MTLDFVQELEARTQIYTDRIGQRVAEDTGKPLEEMSPSAYSVLAMGVPIAAQAYTLAKKSMPKAN